MSGSGPAGLLFVQLARACGCTPILLRAGGGRPEAPARPPELGATGAWSHRDPEIARRVLDATGGEGVDIAVEASGSDEAVGHAFDLVRRGGRVVLYGISGTGRPNIASDLIVSKDLGVVSGIGRAPCSGTRPSGSRAAVVGGPGVAGHPSFPLEDHDRFLAVAADVDQSVKVVLTP
ncbi:MAG: zinc-binding dehydrogenase [Isosphaeraceae bacterium]